MSANLPVAYAVLGVYLLLVLGTGVLGAFMNFFNQRKRAAQGEAKDMVGWQPTP